MFLLRLNTLFERTVFRAKLAQANNMWGYNISSAGSEQGPFTHPLDMKRKCNVLLTVHRDISVRYESTGCFIYFQFISIINLYMFRAGLLLIIRRHYSVYTTIGIVYVMRLCWLPVGRIKILSTASQHKHRFQYIQGVSGGMCQTLGDCSLS